MTQYSRENIFAIRRHLCPKCLIIEPIIYGYGSVQKANLSRISLPIHTGCMNNLSRSSSERHAYLKLNLTKGFPAIVREWVKINRSSNHCMWITALKVPIDFNPNMTRNDNNVGVPTDISELHTIPLSKSTNSSVIVVSLKFCAGQNGPKSIAMNEEITLYYDWTDFLDLSSRSALHPYPQIPNAGNSFKTDDDIDKRSIIEKAIESSDIVIKRESELLEFLMYTKFGTFGFFRTSSSTPSLNSVSSGHSRP